ncbi:hypothetical protein DIPPA_31637 [Diplonema papillatum]|nr:hypothetical protein DIPPA_31637 [Diplonema papillatum]
MRLSGMDSSRGHPLLLSGYHAFGCQPPPAVGETAWPGENGWGRIVANAQCPPPPPPPPAGPALEPSSRRKCELS